MVSGLIIRFVTEADAAEIAAIYAEHVTHGTATFDTETPTVEATREKIWGILNRGWPFFVAESEATVMGYAYATQFRDRPGYAATCEDSIYVAGRFQRRGVGKALLVALLNAAHANGFRQMLAVIGGEQPSSIALHRSLGFRHAGQMRSVGRKFGRWLDTHYMQCEIGDGDRTPPRWE